MNENSRPRIPNEWVRYMYEKLESGELTYATVLKKVPYSYQNVTIFKQVSRNTLKKHSKKSVVHQKLKVVLTRGINSRINFEGSEFL
ncbi:hypothetical protein TVAG_580110 [Trichomonas vaginalis G3]|uniref:Uncharacterized protein n=1 Tax=Trichomonas vaginalis (strain ATCC PRA-98 / G3) TaxID=412133 RepID=A2H085_TRIV3|nr:hypothetical protein TVAGG3_0824400 [Trichomonas vaginalis G3]EAX77182.1 hypothetical protein TVAG_580110 [Trichomonas vaginalis G3]KAI5498114.1 hypothetical protein TVAGG3_0824400 [Trichomonas vaginalis G3]|eukprot:XP_001290112.1 hypothetical protein [Trichomonas vaginalis G3]